MKKRFFYIAFVVTVVTTLLWTRVVWAESGNGKFFDALMAVSFDPNDSGRNSEIEKLLESNGISETGKLLSRLPSDLQSQFALQFRSVRQASLDQPRIILYGADQPPKMLMAIRPSLTGGAEVVDIIRNGPDGWEFLKIDLPGRSQASSAKAVARSGPSLRSGAEESPPNRTCVSCHSRRDPANPSRRREEPIWRSQEMSGAFGGSSDTLTSEQKNAMRNFVKTFKAIPGYETMIATLETDLQAGGAIPRKPNATFAARLSPSAPSAELPASRRATVNQEEKTH